MKAAVAPVFVTAGLLAFADEIAIYEHGTFKPLLTPEISERMVRNPGHFDIKHFANTTGARRQAIDALAKRLEVRPAFRKQRVANVLAIVGHLVSRISHLDNYTLRTSNITATTRNARDALVAAVEPDELLFVTFPKALGFEPVPSDTKTYRNARAYANSVGERDRRTHRLLPATPHRSPRAPTRRKRRDQPYRRHGPGSRPRRRGSRPRSASVRPDPRQRQRRQRP